MMINEKTAIFYTTDSARDSPLVDRLNAINDYRVIREPLHPEDPFMLDPSVRSGRSGNLYEGQANVIRFILHEERVFSG